MQNYAGFWIRFAAYLIDSIIMTFVMLVIIFLLGAVLAVGSGGEPSETASGVLGLMFYVLIFGANWLYFALMESGEKQATLGKMAVGLVVTDEMGERISFGKATGRYFGKIVSSLIMYIGFIMIAFTDRKQGLHDMMAGTLVQLGKPGDHSSNAGVFS